MENWMVHANLTAYQIKSLCQSLLTQKIEEVLELDFQ